MWFAEDFSKPKALWPYCLFPGINDHFRLNSSCLNIRPFRKNLRFASRLTTIFACTWFGCYFRLNRDVWKTMRWRDVYGSSYISSGIPVFVTICQFCMVPSCNASLKPVANNRQSDWQCAVGLGWFYYTSRTSCLRLNDSFECLMTPCVWLT